MTDTVTAERIQPILAYQMVAHRVVACTVRIDTGRH
jgi:hypothetical protein